MLISIRDLTRRFDVRPNGVLHLGAHTGEEMDEYARWRWGHVWWVEANPAAFETLRHRMRRRAEANTPILALVGATDGEKVTLHIASNGESSSVLPLGTHATEHPDVTYTGELVTDRTVSVDSLVRTWGIEADFVNIDLQGYELEALRGAPEFLERVRWAYIEVNRRELYEGCPMVGDLDRFLKPYGLLRATTRWTRHHWGDALYQRERRRR